MTSNHPYPIRQTLKGAFFLYCSESHADFATDVKKSMIHSKCLFL